MERRRTTRFGLQCPATCKWKDEAGVVHTISGVTRNISAGGLLVSLNQRPSARALASVEIRLPRRNPWTDELQLQGTGRVVRILDDESGCGFAVENGSGWSISRSCKQVLASK